MSIIWKLKRKLVLVRVWIYRMRGIEIGLDKSMLPLLGRGKWYSVLRVWNIIRIVKETGDVGEEIRLIPYWPNHGVMVEHWKDGKMCARYHADFRTFREYMEGNCEKDYQPQRHRKDCRMHSHVGDWDEVEDQEDEWIPMLTDEDRAEGMER